MAIPLPYGKDYYYSDEFKTIVRSCKEVLLNVATYSPFLDKSIAFAYRYNFHKFLRNLRTSSNSEPAIPEELIWAISFINGIEDPKQTFEDRDGIYLITTADIDALLQTTTTRRE
jgi:hypothetical protein